MEVVKAVSSADRDFGTYKCQFSLIVEFYTNTNYLGEIFACGGLFRVDGKQYRAEDLRQLVEGPFMEAYEKRVNDLFKKRSDSQ